MGGLIVNGWRGGGGGGGGAEVGVRLIRITTSIYRLCGLAVTPGASKPVHTLVPTYSLEWMIMA